MAKNTITIFALAILMMCNFASVAAAGTITFGGLITQSLQDGFDPAVNNTSLNAIQDSHAYLVTLIFTGPIGAPGFYDLTGSSLTFSDPSAPATESSFDFISLNIAANGAFDDLSLFACLTTGGGCGSGNQLTANFRILAASLTSVGVAATGLDEPHPLDLLEDDGFTDIHGSITAFSNTSVPEPSTFALLSFALAVLVARTKLAGKKPIRGENL